MRARANIELCFSSFSFCFSFCTMFEFQNLELYKKAKAFHIECKMLILNKKLDHYVKDQLGRASSRFGLNSAEKSLEIGWISFILFKKFTPNLELVSCFSIFSYFDDFRYRSVNSQIIIPIQT